MATDVEYLTDELKHLVGWGAKPHRLPALPTLRRYAGADDAPSHVTAGHVMRLFLKDELQALEGVYDFAWGWQRRQLPADVMRRSYGLLLGLEASSKNVTNRRDRVIQLIGLTGCAVETWRRPFGPERDFLHLLAEHIYQRAIGRAA